jgi:hypothetical protein
MALLFPIALPINIIFFNQLAGIKYR